MEVRPALRRLLTVALMSLAAPLAWSFPLHDSLAGASHAGKTVQPAVQHTVRPLGNHLRAVRPIGHTRTAPRTIVAKRPS